MSIVIDLVIIGVILLCIIIGYIRGLTGALIKILSFVVSLIIAFVLYIPVSNFIISNTQIDENLQSSIKNIILQEEADDVQENMPTAITDYINNKIEETANKAKENIVNSTASDVSTTIIRAGTWIGLFIVSRILLILLKFVTALITKLPVIKQFDKVGGVIYGLLEGLIITYMALAVISFVAPIINKNLPENINNSYLGSQMYNNNLLLKIIF